MKKHLVLIKMGGSLITDKIKPNTFRKDHVHRIASEIRKLQTEDVDFLLGTGAGSFGHFAAHQYGLREGAHTSEQFYGTCVTHNATQRLSGLVADEFTKKKVGVFTLSPSSMMNCRDGNVTSIYEEPMCNLLSSGIIPLVHGDTITDTSRGTTILSTEKVLHACMKYLRSDYEKLSLIYLLDADGVLDKEHRVMSAFTANDTLVVHGSLTHDVTGGIAGKVKSARLALEYADSIYLVNGMTPGVIEKVLAGETVGTRII